MRVRSVGHYKPLIWCLSAQAMWDQATSKILSLLWSLCISFHKPLNWIKQLAVLWKAEFYSPSDNFFFFFFSDTKQFSNLLFGLWTDFLIYHLAHTRQEISLFGALEMISTFIIFFFFVHKIQAICTINAENVIFHLCYLLKCWVHHSSKCFIYVTMLIFFCHSPLHVEMQKAKFIKVCKEF